MCQRVLAPAGRVLAAAFLALSPGQPVPALSQCGQAIPDCLTYRCDTTTKEWVPTGGKKAAGTACNDFDPQTYNDRCDGAGNCGGTQVVCEGSNPCEVKGYTGTAACTVSAAPAGTVCRAPTLGCDVPATCNGSSTVCPANPIKPAGTVCRPVAGPCDVQEVCTGTSALCPVDRFSPNSLVCRASAGVCDTAEKCTGNHAACPADTFLPSTTICRAQAGICDVADRCTGTSAACPPDAFQPAGLLCRAAAGPCDLSETCMGDSAACPADVFLASTAQCRGSTGPCDPAEYCTGGAASCPADAFLAAGTPCESAAGCVCDAAHICKAIQPTRRFAFEPATNLTSQTPVGIGGVCGQ